MGRLPAEVQTDRRVSVNKVSSASFLRRLLCRQTTTTIRLFISNYLDVYVRDALKRVNGVGDVIIFGERKYAMRLWLDPVRLAKRELDCAPTL